MITRLLWLWHEWFLWRERQLDARPMPDIGPDAVALLPRGGGPLAGHVVFRFASPRGRHHVRAYIVRSDGAQRPLADLPAIRSGAPIERSAVVPRNLRHVLAFAPGRDVGEVTVREAGRIPWVVLLAVRFVGRLRHRPAHAWLAAARRAWAILRSRGPEGVLVKLREADEVRGRWAGDGPGGPGSLPVRDAPGDHRCDPAVTAAFTSEAEADLDRFLAGSGSIRFEQPEDPTISVVVVTFGSAPLVLRCLEALAEHAPSGTELIVIDNDPADRRVAALLDRLSGAQVVRNDRNVGFGGACNQGVALARGEHVLLLNSDAIVTPGAIAAALGTAVETGAGAVGARVVGLDGRLLEAGSIVWRDGSCEPFGRGLHPDRAEFLHRREVDFVSGVFLLTPRAVWNRLGGLDRCFDPAYYEDVDFCLRLREEGLRVLYEPKATIVHAEHGSGSLESARALMLAHRPILVQRHDVALAQQLPRSRGMRMVASVADRDRRSVLVVDDRVPLADYGSGAPRMAAMLRALADDGVRVTLYAKLVPDAGRDLHEALPAECEVVLGYGLDRVTEVLAERPGSFDAVIVSRMHNFIPVASALRQQPELLGGAALVYDAESIGALRRSGRAALDVEAGHEEHEPELHPDLDDEVDLARGADAVLAVSGREADAFTEAGCTNVHVVSHAVPVRVPRADAVNEVRRDSLLFVGSLALPTLPNVDSLRWYTTEIAPVVERRLGTIGRPGVSLRAIGVASEAVKAELTALAGPAVHLVGRVDDLDPEYRSARVFVAPTRFGAGIPLKVIEAAAHGVPSVVTPLLADQLGWAPGAVVVGSDAEDFADGIVRLLTHDDLWERTRDAALAAVAEHHDPGVLRAALTAALASVVPPDRRAPHRDRWATA